MVDTTFFFLSLGYRRDLFTSTVHISGIFDGEHSRETQDVEILLFLGRVQCNCDMVGPALCFSTLPLLSLDMPVAVYPVARSTTIESLLLHLLSTVIVYRFSYTTFNLSDAFCLARNVNVHTDYLLTFDRHVAAGQQ